MIDKGRTLSARLPEIQAINDHVVWSSLCLNGMSDTSALSVSFWSAFGSKTPDSIGSPHWCVLEGASNMLGGDARDSILQKEKPPRAL